MRTTESDRYASVSKQNFALSALAICILTTLVGCGGGAAGTEGSIGCGSTELVKAGGGCQQVALLDVNNDGTIDGVDISGDGIPEMNIVAGGASTKGLDLNGDGNADYFLKQADGKLQIFASAEASGNAVTVILGGDGKPEGLRNNDNGSIDNRISEKESPTITASPDGGLRASAPEVTLNCTDNVVCNAIAYTLDGSEPTFAGGGSVVLGHSVSFQLVANSSVTLKYRARDAAGNLSEMKTAVFTLGCPSSPIANAGADFELSMNASEPLNGAASSTSIGTIQSYKWRKLAAGNSPVASDEAVLDGVTPTIIAPGHVTTFRYQLEVTDTNNCKATDEVLAFVMREKAKGVFVNGEVGDDTTGDGSRVKPVATLRKGVALASLDLTNPKDVYAAAKANATKYIEATSLDVAAGVSLFGGFNSAWVRDTDHNRSILNGAPIALDIKVGKSGFLDGFDVRGAESANAGQDTIAVRVRGTSASDGFTVSHSVLLAGSVGSSQSGVTSAGSSFGLYVSTVGRLAVEKSEITSGKAGVGAAGAVGAAGKPGSPGAAGNAGGSGGQPGAGSGTPNIAGGAGGAGGQTASTLEGTKGIDGKFDSLTSARGGTGGIEGKTGALNGGVGLPGEAGANGKPAALAGPTKLTFNHGTYTPQRGNAGLNGLHGGGAGGGGGGAAVLTVKGGGGGGGGSGGSFGLAGQGGFGGGAAVGLFVESTSSVVLRDNVVITAGEGGAAGAAGLGGGGGLGGAKGIGDVGGTGAGRGGDGGKGGDGGAGGDGGGGIGGPVIGLYVGVNTAATVDASVSIKLGKGGSGGSSRNGSGGAGGNVIGVFDVDAPTTPPSLENPDNISLPVGGLGGLGGSGGPGAVGANGTAVKKNW